MSDANKIMEMIKENDISFVDLRFTDPRGKMHHVTQHIDTIDEALAEGFMFDGSSIAGWKAINESDMCLMPICIAHISIHSLRSQLWLYSVTCLSQIQVKLTAVTLVVQPKLL